MKDLNRSCSKGEASFIGCCGAYCKTCRSFILGSCRGCKLGYADGERNIAKARCRIKVCCLGTKNHETCADCPGYDGCGLLAAFHAKSAPEYSGYRNALEFIRANGYADFVKRAGAWKRSFGEL